MNNVSNLMELVRNSAGVDNRGITFICSDVKEYFVLYRELYEKSLSILFQLQEKGLKPKDELIFQVDNNDSFISYFWACILGGIIPVPVSLCKMAEDKKKILRLYNTLNKPRILGSKDLLYDLIEFINSEKINFNADDLVKHSILVDQTIDLNKKGIIYDAKGDDIALIQFSSGSTGEPKGVILTHGNILSNIQAMIKLMEVRDDDLLLSWMPLTHNFGLVGCHLLPMAVKVNQHLMPTELFLKQPDLWINKVSTNRATILQSPNFAYRHLLSCMNKNKVYDLDLSSVRIIVNGSEPISTDLCEQFLNTMSKFKLKQNVIFPAYGLAEATLEVASPPVGEEIVRVKLDRQYLSIGDKVRIITDVTDTRNPTFVDLGYPVEGCEIRICNEFNNVLEENVVGKIQVKGKITTKGYYNNKEATEKLYTSDGWLETGDLGVIYNGRLIVTGRFKEIIFINGHNFYPNDIEKVIERECKLSMGSVVSCGVNSKEKQTDELLVFVQYNQSIIEFAKLAERIKKTINSIIGIDVKDVIPLEIIPKTSSGKIQRFIFSENYKNGYFDSIVDKVKRVSKVLDDAKEKIIATEGTEKVISEICCDILNVNEISINDDFFELGTDSIKAAKIINGINSKLEIDINISELFNYPSIALLAGYIESKILNKPQLGGNLNTIIPIENRKYYEVSESEKRMFIMYMMSPESTKYNISQIAKIEGTIDEKRMKNAFAQLIERHEILRSSYEIIGGEIVRKIHDSIQFNIEKYTCYEGQENEIIKKFVRPFDLTSGPLVRVGIIMIDETKYYMIFDIHHIISDGTSLLILLDEIKRLYSLSELEPLKVQYKDYAVWHNVLLKSDFVKEQEVYWRNKLDNFQYTEINKYYGTGRSGGGNKRARLNYQIVNKITEYCNKHKMTKFSFMLSVFNLLMFFETGQRYISVGSPVSGRGNKELESMLGIFINVLMLNTEVDSSMTFEYLAKETAQNVREAYANQEFPYNKLFDIIKEKMNFQGESLFSVLFNYLPYSMEEKIQFDGFVMSHCDVDGLDSNYNINFKIFEGKDDLFLDLLYKREIYDDYTIERILNKYISLIDYVIQNTAVRICDMDIYSKTNEYSDDYLFDELENEELI